jgi:hypothetical protein
MFPKAETGVFALILFVWKFVMETFDADETEPGPVFNLHDKPRLLAKSSVECSHSIFKQVQWYLQTISTLIKGLPTVLCCWPQATT